MALKEEYAGEVEFIVADFDDQETYKLLDLDQFFAPYIPMFFFINGRGEVLSGEAGVYSYTEMVERINPILK